jgi:SAM-dependent methyltransferase
MNQEKKVFNRQYSKYYNLFYAEKAYDKEVAFVEQRIKNYAPSAKRLLEYGSGTGGHGVLLNEKGYEVFGIEQSEEMAEVAKGKGLSCVVGDITTYKSEEKFDACIALFHVISYINLNDSLIQLFSNTRKHLTESGIFVFDVWYTPAVLHQKPEVRVKKITNDEIEATRIAVPVIDHVHNIVDVNYQILIKDLSTGRFSEFAESHKMRHFGIPEIDLLARQTGFRLLQAEEFLTGNKPSVDTWGVNFILQVA